MLVLATVPAPLNPESRRDCAVDLSDSIRGTGVIAQARVRHIVVDADGEVVFGCGLASSSKTALTIVGVNSFEERP